MRFAKTSIALSVLIALSAHAKQQDEILTVYGQKLERTAQETKESVAVLDETQLSEIGANDINDVINYTANAYSVDNGDQFGIRGVTQNSKSTGAGESELATTYIDGVAYSGFASRFGPKNLWDVEQIEILRGPQSTNFGRNSLIGAVAVTTNKPVIGSYEGALRADIGNDGRQTYDGMVNIPISDIAAFRLTGTYSEENGYIYNVPLDDSKYDAKRDHNVRGQLLITPTEKLAINLMLQSGEINRGRDVYEVPEGANPEDRQSLSAVNEFTNYEVLTSALNIDYQINSNWALKSTTAYLEGERKTLEYDHTTTWPQQEVYGNFYAKDKNISQELRANYTSSNFKGTFGVYAAQVELTNNKEYVYSIIGSIPSEFNSTSRNYAIFAEGDYQFAPKWLVSAGFRYDTETQDNNAGGTLYDASYDAFLPQFGLTYQAASNIDISGFYKKGYRTGGSEPLVVNRESLVNQYDPEYLDMYELAFRSVWLDSSLYVNSNLYYGDWSNQQVRSDSAYPGTQATQNAGKSSIYGAELEVQYYPTSDLSLYYNLGLSQAKFDDFKTSVYPAEGGPAETVDYSGNQFAFSPTVSSSLGGRYYVTDALYLGGNVNYQGEQYADQANTQKLDARTLVNLNAGYEIDRFLIEAYVDNLTDEFYITSQYLGMSLNNMVQAGKPREFGIRGTVKF